MSYAQPTCDAAKRVKINLTVNAHDVASQQWMIIAQHYASSCIAVAIPEQGMYKHWAAVINARPSHADANKAAAGVTVVINVAMRCCRDTLAPGCLPCC